MFGFRVTGFSKGMSEQSQVIKLFLSVNFGKLEPFIVP